MEKGGKAADTSVEIPGGHGPPTVSLITLGVEVQVQTSLHDSQLNVCLANLFSQLSERIQPSELQPRLQRLSRRNCS